MYARPIHVQTLVHSKNLQFLAVTYDLGFLAVFSTLSKPLFKQFLVTEMTWSQPIIVRECIFKDQNLSYPSLFKDQNLSFPSRQVKG